MPPDLWSLYGQMYRSRLFEEAIARLWHDGFISGEMHLGTGEEAIAAGVVAHLRPGDAMALDHRGTAPLLMRGVDPGQILRELLGMTDGLCGGMGGHMHLFSREHLCASSGIVGAAGPMAAGFALAAEYLRPDSIAVAFFGEGAMNQGMVLESLNLAAVWNLPVLFVCKDDGWSITTPSQNVTRGELNARASALGVWASEVEGSDVVAVWEQARVAVDRARSGGGPTFLRARCVHTEAHFLGLPLLRAVRSPLRELPGLTLPLVRSLVRRKGAATRDRLSGAKAIVSALASTWRDPRRARDNDPLHRARRHLLAEPSRLADLEDRLESDVAAIVETALVGVRP